MFYYKFTAEVEEKNSNRNDPERNERHARVRHIADKIEEFNERNCEDRFCFISNIGNDGVTGGAIFSEAINPEKTIASFLKTVLAEATDIRTSETTFQNISRMLSSASHGGYIDDDDEILETFGLGSLSRPGWRGALDFGEDIIADSTADAQDKACDELVANETLGAEIRRIRAGKANTKAFGHPVHYLIECDDSETIKEMHETLLEALYANGTAEQPPLFARRSQALAAFAESPV